MEPEEFIGGVASGRMLGAGGIAGYAIYLTSRRLFGAKDRKALWKGIAGSALWESPEPMWERRGPEIIMLRCSMSWS